MVTTSDYSAIFFFVLVFNGILALLCLAIAWQFLKLRRILAKAARVIDRAERGTNRVLSGAPRQILKGERGTQSLRHRLQALEGQLARLQLVINLLGWGQKIRRPRSR